MEKRTFTPHQNLIIEVIKSQAGTLGKAILEGAMNSIDAGATECHIELTPKKLTIMDDGRGFADRKEIELFFEVFGQPHEKGDATYGRFRMGRGQLFSFGKNDWHSNQFKMEVDIEQWVLEYRLREDMDDKYDGCFINIELYEELNRATFMSICQEIRDYLKYAQIPIHFNGECISVQPSNLDWDIVNDDFYFKKAESGTMSVYNLGVLVSHMHYFQFGMGGTIVSKKQLQVNFARNDVMSKCPVWKRIKDKIGGVKKTEKKKSMNDDDRLYEARNIIAMGNGQGTYDDLKLRIITDVCNKQHSIKKLLQARLYSSAPNGDVRGDSVHQSKSVFVIGKNTLDRFGVRTAPELMEILAKKFRNSHYFYDSREREYISYDKMVEQFGSSHRAVEVGKYTSKEKVWVALAKLMSIHKSAYDSESEKWGWHTRDIRVGKSDNNLAWTDGHSYICLDKKFLAGLRYESGADIGKLGAVLLHEYCHTSENLETDTHGEAFYELYEKLAVNDNILGRFFNEALMKLPDLLAKNNLKESKRVSRFVDKVKNIKTEAKKASDISTLHEMAKAVL